MRLDAEKALLEWIGEITSCLVYRPDISNDQRLRIDSAAHKCYCAFRPSIDDPVEDDSHE